ncbi:uncharacterized protein [Miscanthus floridulus]|uniref:uncharacterized protein isoform X2 n=1 Tax=Miscanthus floridulus TaxID=154761 RepID=UPI0034581F75
MLLMSLRAADPYEQETCRMFMEWKAKYRQTYRYAGEEECRYAVFKESRRRVARARAAGVTSGLNGRSATAIEEIYRGHRVRMGERSFEQETRRMFVGWKAKYGKTYRDVGEEECRYRLFKGNHRRVVVRLNRRRRAKPVRPQPIRRPHQRGGPLTLLPGDGGPRAERQVPSRRPRPGPRPWEADPLPGALWTLWKTRNGVIFNGKVLASLKTIIHKTILLVKSWKPLLKPKSQDMADTIQGKLQRSLAEA